MKRETASGFDVVDDEGFGAGRAEGGNDAPAASTRAEQEPEHAGRGERGAEEGAGGGEAGAAAFDE